MNKLIATAAMIAAYLIAASVMAAVIVGRENRRNQKMSELSILTALVKGGMTPKAACAMGGNMMAESGMKSNIAQRGMTKLTDEKYTQSADAGTIDFVNDAVGYGLCQWTFPLRKAKLSVYAYEHNKSLGDEAMQVQFCLAELKTDYSELWNYLCTEHDGYYIDTERICKEYERPAVNNVDARFRFAQELYEKYGEALTAVGNGGTVKTVPYGAMREKIADGNLSATAAAPPPPHSVGKADISPRRGESSPVRGGKGKQGRRGAGKLHNGHGQER